MKGKDLLEHMDLVDPAYVEEAARAGAGRKKVRRMWPVLAAACLLLVVAGTFWWKGGDGCTAGQTDNQEELDRVAATQPLVQRLKDLGASMTGIQVCYASENETGNTGDWNELSVSGQYDGQDFSLDCSRSAGPDTGSDVSFSGITIGGANVLLLQERADDGSTYMVAVFNLNGVDCRFTLYGDDPEELLRCLDKVLGDQEDGDENGQFLEGVLGFDVCRVDLGLSPDNQLLVHYMVVIDGKEVCVAEQFGYDGPESWNRDLDGDGVPELICNCVYGDGCEQVQVYRNRDGVIEVGMIPESWYRETLGWTEVGMDGISSLPVERWDPERNVFSVTDYHTYGYENAVEETFTGLEPFEFEPFAHLR